MFEMDKCREEFEKQRYWIGLFRDAVDFDEKLGRYVLNGQRKLYAFHLDSFNEKWAIWQEAWQHQQAKVEELQNNINLLNEALDIKEQLNQKLREREDELQKQLSEYIFVSETLDEMYVKEAQKSDELQKRVDKALELMQKPVIVGEPTNYVCARFKELERALKGEGQ
ncbi:hypothetical protein AXY19_RS03050 [Acinetobacter baumannii]|nr:hypothetical protein [Acinetobacter baumannii]